MYMLIVLLGALIEHPNTRKFSSKKNNVIIIWSKVTPYVFKTKFLFIESLTNALGHRLTRPILYIQEI